MKTLGLFGTFMVAGFIVILIGDFFVPWVSALLFLAATFFFVDFVVATFFVGGDTTLLLGLALTGEPEEAARPFETFFTNSHVSLPPLPLLGQYPPLCSMARWVDSQLPFQRYR